MRADPVRTKPASGRLNRPTKNPLTVRQPRASTQFASQDKYAVVVDTIEQEVPTKTSKRSTKDAVPRGGPQKANVYRQESHNKSLVPIGKEKRRRGRPPKAEATATGIKEAKVKASLVETVAKVVHPPSRQSARHRDTEPRLENPVDVLPRKSVSSQRTASPLLRHTALGSSSDEDEADENRAVSRGSGGSIQSNNALLAHSPARPQQVQTGRIQANGPLPAPKTVAESVGVIRDDEVDVEHELSERYLDDEEAEPLENNSEDPQDISSDSEFAEENIPDGTATELNGREEVAESEDEDIPDSNQENDVVRDLELFGGRNLWVKALDGARTAGASRVKGERILKRPKIATDSAKDFVALVNEARSIYTQLASDDLAVVDEEDVEQRLQDCHEDINEFVDNLSEDEASEDKRAGRLLIQDVYTHIIPAMVFMLGAAVVCRSVHYSDPEDLESLEEIVHIQAKIVRLCEKARRWKAKPITRRPITNSVANKILPSLRDLKLRCFGRELEQRRELVKAKAREQALLESHRRERQRRIQEKLDFEQRRRDNLNSMPEKRRQLEVQQTVSNRQFRQVRHLVRSHPSGHSTTADRWTVEQNNALVEELLSERTRDLPGKPRV